MAASEPCIYLCLISFNSKARSPEKGHTYLNKPASSLLISMFDVSAKIKTIKNEFKYSRMDQVKFVEFKCAMTFKKIWGIKTI